MGDIVAGHAVVVAQVPLALELDNAVVGGPADDGIEDDSLIGEGSVRIVADGIAQVVAVASGVREIVLAVVLVHPAGLKEAVGIAGLQGHAVLVENKHRTRSLCKLQHIVAHAHHIAGNGEGFGLGKQF